MDHALDYRFGWLWLLQGSPSVAHGFTDSESRHIERHQSPESSSAGADPWLVVNGDACGPELLSSAAGESVLIVASRSSGKRWKTKLLDSRYIVREYALLPPANPRVIVPLDRTGMLAGLDLHRPGRMAARIAVFAARTFAWVGSSLPLRSRMLIVGRASLDGSRDFALYLGTPTEDRKTTALELATTSAISLLKCGRSPAARSAVEHEAEVLELLQATAVRGQVPALIERKVTKDESSIRQEYRRRKFRAPWKFRLDAAQFLGKLAQVEPRSMTLEEALARHAGLADDSSDMAIVARLLMARIRASAWPTIRTHRSHGDFAPWNCAWTNRGFFVFDWERSADCTHAYDDAFYFAIAPELLIRKRVRPGHCVRRAMAFAREVACRSGMRAEDMRIYLALWLLDRLTVAPAYLAIARELDRSWGRP